eukprot:4379251-Prymnesium_polylepis.1
MSGLGSGLNLAAAAAAVADADGSGGEPSQNALGEGSQVLQMGSSDSQLRPPRLSTLTDINGDTRRESAAASLTSLHEAAVRDWLRKLLPDETRGWEVPRVGRPERCAPATPPASSALLTSLLSLSLTARPRPSAPHASQGACPIRPALRSGEVLCRALNTLAGPNAVGTPRRASDSSKMGATRR